MGKFLGSFKARLALAIGAAGAASVMAVMVLPMTFGTFSDQTTNTGNAASLGTLLVSNSKGGSQCTGSLQNSVCSSVIGISNLKPGDTDSKTVTITNSGSLGGIYTMKLTGVQSFACSSACGGVGTATTLADHINLFVSDEASRTVFGAACTGATGDPGGAGNALSQFTAAAQLLPTVDNSDHSWPALQGHTYTVKICIPSALDNSFQGTSATFTIEVDGIQTAGVDN